MAVDTNCDSGLHVLGMIYLGKKMKGDKPSDSE